LEEEEEEEKKKHEVEEKTFFFLHAIAVELADVDRSATPLPMQCVKYILFCHSIMLFYSTSIPVLPFRHVVSLRYSIQRPSPLCPMSVAILSNFHPCSIRHPSMHIHLSGSIHLAPSIH
jgi:hypothetical protein